MGSTYPPGPALVTASADADPVTLLVLGWLAAPESCSAASCNAVIPG